MAFPISPRTAGTRVGNFKDRDLHAVPRNRHVHEILYLYIYIYIYTHTTAHIHAEPGKRGRGRFALLGSLARCRLSAVRLYETLKL